MYSRVDGLQGQWSANIIERAQAFDHTNRIYLRLSIGVSTACMAFAETPCIARVGDWAVGKALAVGMLALRWRMRMRMWTTFVRHVEALREASRHAMGRRMGMVALRRGVRSHERLLRGHDGEVGHAAAGRKWEDWLRMYATQGDVMRCCYTVWGCLRMGKRGRCFRFDRETRPTRGWR